MDKNPVLTVSTKLLNFYVKLSSNIAFVVNISRNFYFHSLYYSCKCILLLNHINLILPVL